MNLKTIKSNVQSLLPYSVPTTFNGVKLNQNEGPNDLASKIKEEICQRLCLHSWNRYPSLTSNALLKKIAAYTTFPVSGILIGAGSNELIQTLIFASCNTGDTLLTVSPTFPVYRRVADIMGIQTIEIPLQTDFSFDVPVLLETISQISNLKIIILACPNNPTGTVLSVSEIDKIATQIQKYTSALLVIDEAYFEFYRQSAQKLLDKYSHLVILRTFSKALSAAAVRLGYLLASPSLISQLEKVKLPFSIGLFQQVAGEVLLEKYQSITQDIITTIKERERVFSVLTSFPDIKPIPSQANFILFHCDNRDATVLFRALQEKGVLLRYYGTGVLSGMLRVSIGTRIENNQFIETLRVCLNEIPIGGRS